MSIRKRPVESERRRGWPLILTWTGLGMVTVLLVLSAAGQAAQAREGESDPPHLDSPAAIPYTTLIDVQTIEPSTLDPHWLYDAASMDVATQVYETLLTYRRENPNVLLPQLATGWTVSPDARVYTFAIRSGVHFHAGGTLEAHDVAYSFWRGLIQDRAGGPMWMWFDAFFAGTGSIDDLPGDDLAKCQAVRAAITYDDAQRTVTFHLSKSLGAFLNMLTMSSASILDQEWMAAHGGWAGNCTDWRTYHDPDSGDSILYDQVNGTAPFRLDHWTPGEIGLVRYDGYWRQTPAWPEGPSGPAALETVLIQYVPDSATRRDMLLNGQTDMSSVDPEDMAALDPWIWGRYDGYQDGDPTLLSPTGSLRLYRQLPSMAQTPAQLNYAITAGSNPYIGSGTLDGDGIPPDFFTDIHVRKAFNYAMDWPALIDEIWDGEGIQSRGPIPQGMLGYSSTQPVYPHNPTLSTQEFTQAWGGAVWTQGFSMTIPYNEGNLTRKRIAEILAQNVAALNPKFRIKVVEMPWPDLLADRISGLLPVYIGGWLEDYHHPHNWVYPFLHSQGAYAHVQNFPPALAAQFDAKIEECEIVVDASAAQTCYETIQNMSYVNAAAMWGYQLLERRYVNTTVRGYYSNPAAFAAAPYYALSKGDPPTLATVSDEASSTVVFTTTAGATTSVDVPAGAVSETSTIAYTPGIVVEESHPGGFRLGGVTFDLQICQGGECLAEYPFAETVTLTLEYTDADVAGLIEDELYLYTWDGTTWVDIVTDCGWPLTVYERHPEINELIVPVCHFSRFGLVGDTYDVYLPVVLRMGVEN